MKMQISNPVSRIKSAITSSFHSHKSHSHVTPIDHNDAIEIMSSERRRYTIEYLADHAPDSKVSVSDLTEFVASEENDCSVEELSSKQRNRVYISLYQQHLVNLEWVIEYDREAKQIIPTETPARIWRAYTAFQHSLNS